ncbi:hypothetical protein Geob_0153 [Geotalea daltonii FRC-32]|uniref:Uncharacterized protein n=1 Tax=Geotalea daltonii (strain DSM 22248 / JCM 15807 / FRC-32) TaxID=316067 RepID=B9M8J1_GEODF|nr:hypothetical protein [Geotalea daltonii]ACM18526.1 hypothetical protein Geob_0153 [Geotalea daltonii FRC-32]
MKLNKRMKGYLLGATIAFLLVVAGNTSAQTFCPSPKRPIDCTVDLKSGTASPGCSIAPLSLLVAPVDSNGDGWFEACVHVDLNPAFGNTKIAVATKYGHAPSDWTFNVGDSLTNNGFGGDSSTQSNDSEAQVLNKTLTIFANDNGPGDRISEVIFPRLAGQKVCYEIRDQFIGWSEGALSGSSSTPNPTQMLFALAGESDSEGPINYDVFICGNRVVDGGNPTTRTGKGLRRMQIQLQP